MAAPARSIDSRPERQIIHRSCPTCEASCGLRVEIDVARQQVLRIEGDPEDARSKGAEIIEMNPAGEDFSNQQGTQKIPPTLVKNPTDDMRVLEEEIFGPLLPIKT